MAIPFLPPHAIEGTFQALRAMLFDFDPAHRPKLLAFCHYYKSTWIDKVSNADLSVYRLERCTNNENESYHASLQRIFLTKPAIWCYVKKMNKQTKVDSLNMEQVENGWPVTRPQKRKTVQNLKQRRLAWDKLDAGTYTPLEFDFAASHLMQESIDGVL
jgi:hypothetical protein